MNAVKLITHIFVWTLILCATFLICLGIGQVYLSPSDTLMILSGADGGFLSDIVLNIRLPRIILALAIGGGLSVTGVAFQALLQNPLAEPYILGISSGGAFGAILSLVLGLGFLGTQLFSFGGALIVLVIVFYLGKRFGEIEPNVLLLNGVMAGAFFSAIILLLVSFMDDTLRTAVYWLIGTLSLASPDSSLYILSLSLAVGLLLALNGHKYNVLALGSENAKFVGINTAALHKITYLAASLLIAAIVSVSGIIGFVGLFIPHLCRIIYGYDNRIILPVSYLAGASFLIIADTFARTVLSPSELPVGAVTALVGAPVFILLLKKRFNILK